MVRRRVGTFVFYCKNSPALTLGTPCTIIRLVTYARSRSKPSCNAHKRSRNTKEKVQHEGVALQSCCAARRLYAVHEHTQYRRRTHQSAHGYTRLSISSRLRKSKWEVAEAQVVSYFCGLTRFSWEIELMVALYEFPPSIRFRESCDGNVGETQRQKAG